MHNRIKNLDRTFSPQLRRAADLLASYENAGSKKNQKEAVAYIQSLQSKNEGEHIGKGH